MSGGGGYGSRARSLEYVIDIPELLTTQNGKLEPHEPISQDEVSALGFNCCVVLGRLKDNNARFWEMTVPQGRVEEVAVGRPVSLFDTAKRGSLGRVF